jgi:hypothetical protein
MVGRVICEHRHALVRDLLALGRRADDLFTPRLSFYELICIIVAAPPNSSVRYFLDGGWSQEAQILANMQEGESGFSKLTTPYNRPGAIWGMGDERSAANPFGGYIFKADSYDWDEFTKLEHERYANAQFTPTAGSRRL